MIVHGVSEMQKTGWLYRIFVKKEQREQAEEVFSTGLRDWIQQRSAEVVNTSKLREETRDYIVRQREKAAGLGCRLDGWQQKAREQAAVEEILPLFREARKLLELLQFQGELTLEKVLAVNVQLGTRITNLAQKIESSSFWNDFDFLFDPKRPLDNITYDAKNILNITDTGNITDTDNALDRINPLLKELLDMDTQRKYFEQKVAESGYTAIASIYSKLDSLEQNREKFSRLQKEMDSKKNRLAAAEEKRMEKEKDLHHLRVSSASHDLDALKKKRADIQEQIDDNETELLSFFSKLKPLIRQYADNPSDGLLRLYLEDPLTAFLNDEGLSIKHTLLYLKSLLKSGKISLKPEDFIASLALLESMDEYVLEQKKIKQRRLEQELSKVRELIMHNDLLVKSDDAAYRLEHYTKLVNKLSEETSDMEETGEILRETILREHEFISNLIKLGIGREIIIKH